MNLPNLSSPVARAPFAQNASNKGNVMPSGCSGSQTKCSCAFSTTCCNSGHACTCQFGWAGCS